MRKRDGNRPPYNCTGVVQAQEWYDVDGTHRTEKLKSAVSRTRRRANTKARAHAHTHTQHANAYQLVHKARVQLDVLFRFRLGLRHQQVQPVGAEDWPGREALGTHGEQDNLGNERHGKDVGEARMKVMNA